MFGNDETSGLLCADPALEGVLNWHVEDIRKKATAARFSNCHHHHDGGCGAQFQTSSQQHPEESARGDRHYIMTGISLQQRGRRPQASRDRPASEAWPYASVATQQVASIEFDPLATLGDEESLSTTTCTPPLRNKNKDAEGGKRREVMDSQLNRTNISAVG